MATKPIKGYPGYTISDKGVITRNGNRIAQRKDKDGYMIVDLWNNGSRNTEFVHRLVAKHFSGGAGEDTMHGDGNRSNNSADNVKGGSHKANMKQVSEDYKKKNKK